MSLTFDVNEIAIPGKITRRRFIALFTTKADFISFLFFFLAVSLRAFLLRASGVSDPLDCGVLASDASKSRQIKSETKLVVKGHPAVLSFAVTLDAVRPCVVG